MKVIGFDVETHIIEDGLLTPPLVCATFAGGRDTLTVARKLSAGLTPEEGAFTEMPNGTWELLTSAQQAEATLLELADEVDVVAAHNQVFDWAVMVNENPALLRLVFAWLESGKLRCTKVREMLIAIASDNFKFDNRVNKNPGRFSLAHCVNVYFRTDISASKKDPNAWRLRYHELDGVPINQWPRGAKAYAVEDATWARRVFLAQSEPAKLDQGWVVRPNGEVVNEREQMAADWCLHLMACHGVRTDRENVQQFEAYVRSEAAKADVAARTGGFLRVNRCKACGGTGQVGVVPRLMPCTSCQGMDDMACRAAGVYKSRAKKPFTVAKDMKRLKAWVQHGYGGNAPQTDKGNVKTDNDALLGSGVPVLQAYAAGKEFSKLLDTYVPVLWKGVDQALTSSPNVLVRSGRTSWSKPNLQNPPRKGGFRQCFVPRPGKMFASIDYSGLELTALGQVCLQFFGHSTLVEVINAGQDVHLWFAAKMLNISYEEAARRRAAGDKDIKAKRQSAKIANFGFPGGLGVSAFVQYAEGFGVSLTFNDAETLRNDWLAAFPEMEEYFDMMSSAGNYGDFTIKQVASDRLRGGCHYTSACNSFFQGLAADGAKAAMWALTKECYLDETSPLFGSRIWAFIHDEFLFEMPEKWAPEAAKRAEQIMVREMKKYTPDVRQEAPPALMRRWYKDAEPVYDRFGELVPWEPEQ